ncbi:MAG: GAP family protein [Thermomicrobiales bacterium]
MLSTIGDTATIAAGIAISPLAIVAVILALMSPNATRSGLAFLIGWLIGLGVVLAAFTSLGTLLQESDPDAAKPITGIVKILLGLGLLALGWKQWQSRPAPGETSDLPSWLQAIDGYGPARMIGLGILLTTLAAPKNIMLDIAAAKTLSSAEVPWEQALVVALVFLAAASVSVAGPVIAYLIAPDRVRAPLMTLRAWFAQNAATVMTVVLAILGVNLIGKGLGNF